MTFEERIETSGITGARTFFLECPDEILREIVVDMGRKVWNAAVLACEDAAIRRYEEALEDDFLPGDAFDEAMEAVRGLTTE